MPISPFTSPDRVTRIGVLLVTVLVFGGVVGFITFRLRAGLREQILLREAETLAAVASMQLDNEAATVAQLGLSEVPGQLLTAVLKASTLPGVIGVQVMDAERQFGGAAGLTWSDAPPPPEDWEALTRGSPIARLHRRESVIALNALVFGERARDTDAPWIEAWVPLRETKSKQLAGAAQFWMDGAVLAAEFRKLDRRLWVQASLACIAGTLVILLALSWAFRRLALANRELQARTHDLERANRELVLAAKTSALGAVTAHLIHALKNPIAGLEVFVANQAEPKSRAETGEELVAATELTRRLRAMVNDVVSVLRDEQTGAHFELSNREIAEIAANKVKPSAIARDLRVETEISEATPLAGRRGNLAVLVLQNLLENAIEASPAGQTVTLSSRASGAREIEFVVRDRGRGLPWHVRERLFEPCASTKVGGSGLGLALSSQLARQAGGSVELVSSDDTGTCFRLVLASGV